MKSLVRLGNGWWKAGGSKPKWRQVQRRQTGGRMVTDGSSKLLVSARTATMPVGHCRVGAASAVDCWPCFLTRAIPRGPFFFYPLDTWGKNVAAASPPSWEIYVKSRLSCPPPLSPYGLLQEVYAPDTWKLLVACVLMSRVSSAETKHRCLSAFFDSYPVRAFSRVFVLRVSAPRSLTPCCWRFPE